MAGRGGEGRGPEPGPERGSEGRRGSEAGQGRGPEGRSAGERRPRPPQIVALVWPLLALLVLSAAWEGFADRFSARRTGPIRVGPVVTRGSANLDRTLSELEPSSGPRIALFGSSQIATVKGASQEPELALPYQLHERLSESGVAHEVIDFSAGGQQVAESMVVLFAGIERVRPRVVVVGVSLFSMLRLNVRETLLEEVDVERIRSGVIAHLPDDADAEAAHELLAFSRQASQRVANRGKTIQQRIDGVLADWLGDHLAAVSNRRAMFNDLVDTPIRRDLASWFKRQIEAARTARTYRIGAAYPPSLLALATMADLCRSEASDLLVVLLPFDDSRPPTPFEPETLARMRADLDALSERTGLTWIDASHLLGTEHFGDFVDGSPDNLHFDAGGHARLAEELAGPLAELIGDGPASPPPRVSRSDAGRGAPGAI